jgi:hypothetical protein
MRRERRDADRADEQHRDREGVRFEGELETDRQAEAKGLAQAVALEGGPVPGPPGADVQPEAANPGEETEREQQVRDRGRETGADDAEGRKAEVPKISSQFMKALATLRAASSTSQAA